MARLGDGAAGAGPHRGRAEAPFRRPRSTAGPHVARQSLRDPMKASPRIYFATVALALLAATALPACAQQKLLPAQSDISFVSKQMGVPVEGKFKRFDAQLAFDPKKPEAAKIAMTIDLASVSLGTAETEAELAKPDWFATKQF